MKNKNNFCRYYQAKIDKVNTWFFTGILKSYDYVTFERTLDKENQIFEFFVPEDMNKDFLDFMNIMISKNIASNLCELKNRLI